MNTNLQYIKIKEFLTANDTKIQNLPLSYQVFGKKLGSAPIVLVNHALTGNSQVTHEKGWWKELIGKNKTIDTSVYTILAFNIPGNGFDEFMIDNYSDFTAKDIAKIFLIGLKKLNISLLFAIIGGSLGGGIAWEMAVLSPKITKHLIPVAADWKSTDWLIANCFIQEQILKNSKNPILDARMHAMLCYRTPKSFNTRFARTKNVELFIFNVESWLLHHGEKLQKRYQLSAYKLMNRLLKTIDITQNGKNPIETLNTIQASIHIISIDSDLFFTAEEDIKTFQKLSTLKPNITYNEINSIHGHDAFLIEYSQLSKILKPIFKK